MVRLKGSALTSVAIVTLLGGTASQSNAAHDQTTVIRTASIGDRAPSDRDGHGHDTGENAAVVCRVIDESGGRTVRQEYLYDAKGNIVFSATGGSFDVGSEAAQVFGLTVPLAQTGMKIGDRSDGESSAYAVSNAFGEVELRQSAGRSGASTVTSRAGDTEITATIRELSSTGFAVSDDFGGWRIEKLTGSGDLHRVDDGTGKILEIVRDGRGRLFGLAIGESYILEYHRDAADGTWTRKVLASADSGKVIAEVFNAAAPGSGISQSPREPRPSHRMSQALIPCFGPIAERHEAYGDRWHLVAHVGGYRYAMVPLRGDGPVVRSVQIEGDGGAPVLDRVDYTADRLVVHLGTGDPDAAVVVALPRTPAGSTPPQVFEGWEEPVAGARDAVDSDGLETGAAKRAAGTKLGGLPGPVAHKLLRSFPSALAKVSDLPTCRRLFESFEVSGGERLSKSIYAPPNAAQRRRVCERGVLAFTHVGSPITHLCDGFADLNPDDAAVVLIHEALHFAGMSESPRTPGARTSAQINRMVISACGF